MNKSIINQQNTIRERMVRRGPWFRFVKGRLHIESLSYKNLVERHGTPLVCFSRGRICENAKYIKEIFSKYHKDTRIFYALKANYFKSIISDIKEYAGAEVISLAELRLAQNAGIQNERIIFNGIGKTTEELEACVNEGILVNVDSVSEIEKLNLIAKKHVKTIKIGLRIHPDLKEFEEHAFINKGSKFGFNLEDVPKIMQIISKKKNLQLKGLHSHVCSRQSNPDMYLLILDSMAKLSHIASKNYGIKLEYFDLGGGFETRAVLERKYNLEDIAKSISKRIRKLKLNISLYLEPGRYIVNDAGIVITKVINEKTNDRRKWLITDIATNFLIPVKNAKFEVIPTEKTERALKEVNFGGGICSSADVIEENIVLPEIKEGEFVAILNCGAYTNVMSEMFVYPHPKTVYIDKTNTKILWERKGSEEFLKIYGR